MYITDYELFEVPPRWLFLKLTTSDGTVGWGEPVVEGRSHTVVAAVEELLDNYLLGEDPARIEDHWQAMYRGGFYRGGPVLMSAIAGVDQALWDIKGKQFGAPSTNFSAAVRATESACTSGSAETDQQMSATPLVRRSTQASQR